MEDIQGSIEVIVFPRIFEATRDLWQVDKVLVVRGKVDAGSREPKILCESVQDYLLIVRPIEERRPDVVQANEARTNYALGNGRPYRDVSTSPGTGPSTGVDSGLSTGLGADPGTAVGTPGGTLMGAPAGVGATTDPAPDEEGNGHEATGGVPDARHLQITLHRTGDHQQDCERASEVYSLLQRYAGHDHFSFFVVQGNNRVQIDFPNATTRLTADLAQSLTAMLGRDALQVM